MDRLIAELEVTEKVRRKGSYIVDTSLGKYNQIIEDMYRNDETEFNELQQKALMQRKETHLRFLRKSK